MKTACTEPEFKIALGLLVRIIDGALVQPYEPKKRRIRITNGTFWSKLGCRDGGVDALTAFGFVHAVNEHNQKVLQSGSINTVLTAQNLQQMYAMKLHVNPHPYNDAPMVFSQRQEFS